MCSKILVRRQCKKPKIAKNPMLSLVNDVVAVGSKIRFYALGDPHSNIEPERAKN